jgi:hypothetical protein
LSIFLTVISGVFIFVIGQAILKLIIEPVQEVKKTLAKIQIDQFLLGHIAHNSETFDQNDLDKVFNAYREYSGTLIAHTTLIPFYKNIAKITGLPSKDKMIGASRNLVKLSNWINSSSDVKLGHIMRNTQDLVDNLGLYLSQADRVSDDLIQELMTPKRRD